MDLFTKLASFVVLFLLAISNCGAAGVESSLGESESDVAATDEFVTCQDETIKAGEANTLIPVIKNINEMAGIIAVETTLEANDNVRSQTLRHQKGANVHSRPETVIQYRNAERDRLIKSGLATKVTTKWNEELASAMASGVVKISSPFVKGVPSITNMTELDNAVEAILNSTKIDKNGDLVASPILVGQEKVVTLNPDNPEDFNKALLEKATTDLIVKRLRYRHFQCEAAMSDATETNKKIPYAGEGGGKELLKSNERNAVILKLIPDQFPTRTGAEQRYFAMGLSIADTIDKSTIPAKDTAEGKAFRELKAGYQKNMMHGIMKQWAKVRGNPVSVQLSEAETRTDTEFPPRVSPPGGNKN
jgi:hypothetical protein